MRGDRRKERERNKDKRIEMDGEGGGGVKGEESRKVGEAEGERWMGGG